MKIQTSLILQAESILFNSKANDSYENYSSTLWNLHEYFRVKSGLLKQINSPHLLHFGYAMKQSQNKQSRIPFGLN